MTVAGKLTIFQVGYHSPSPSGASKDEEKGTEQRQKGREDEVRPEKRLK